MKRKLKYLKTVNRRPTDNQLTELWKEACHLRDGGVCRYTKEILHVSLSRNEAVLQIHHVMKKASSRLKWDLDNGIVLTKGVHFSIAHSNSPTQENQFRQWALGRLPTKNRADLEFLERQKKTGGVDKFALKLYLEKKIEKFKEDIQD